MLRRILFSVAMVAMVGGARAADASVPVVGPTTYTFSAASQSNIWTCNGGQSSFALTAPTGFTGVLTVTVSQSSGGTYVNPPWAYAPGAPGYVNTITNSGSLTVNLGSNIYVKVADTTYTSGSVTVTGGCSAAVAVVPPQVTSVGATSPLSSSGGTTPNVSLSGVVPIANGGTGASSLASAPYVVLNPASAQSGGINLSGGIDATSATINGSATIIPAGTATSATNYASAGSFTLQNSTWNGSAAVTNTWAQSEDTLGDLIFNYNGTRELTLTDTGALEPTTPLGVAYGGSGASTLAASPFAVLNPGTAQSGSVNVTGEYQTGSSTYGPTSAMVSGPITGFGVVGSQTYLQDTGGSGTTLPSSASVALSYNKSSTQGEMDLWAQYNDTSAPDANAAFSFWGYNNGVATNYVNIQRDGRIQNLTPIGQYNYVFPSSASSGYTGLISSSGVASGINCNALGVVNVLVANLVCIDTNGDLGAAAAVYGDAAGSYAFKNIATAGAHNAAIAWNNDAADGHTLSQIGSDSTSVVSTIAAQKMYLFDGNSVGIAVDDAFDVGIAGGLYAGGPISGTTGTFSGTATASGGNLAPCYTATGAACGSTYHTVQGTGSATLTCNATALCAETVAETLSGSAVFSGKTYACVVTTDNFAVSAYVDYGATPASGFTINFFDANSGPLSAVATAFTYTCSGT